VLPGPFGRQVAESGDAHAAWNAPGRWISWSGPQRGSEAWQPFVEALDDFLPPFFGGAALALDELTARERDILEFVAQGLDNSGVAARLKIAEKNVRNHISIIFSKLGVNSRAQVIVLARDAGFGRRGVR
jgi:DNA-binding NarL/FixJ family response regulator